MFSHSLVVLQHRQQSCVPEGVVGREARELDEGRGEHDRLEGWVILQRFTLQQSFAHQRVVHLAHHATGQGGGRGDDVPMLLGEVLRPQAHDARPSRQDRVPSLCIREARGGDHADARDDDPVVRWSRRRGKRRR